jgi:hypothetical protein
MTIELPTRAVRDYISAFKLGAIYLVAGRTEALWLTIAAVSLKAARSGVHVVWYQG